MIKRLRLLNILSHKKTEINFCEGINVITGRTDSGKSTIIRGLIWDLNNTPSSDSLRRQGTKRTAAAVLFKNGLNIERRKSNTENQYLLNGDVLDTPGRGLPEEIQTVLNMTTLNWQQQHNNIFLLSETPRNISKRINEIVHLEESDEACAEIKRRVQKQNALLFFKTEELEKKLKQEKDLKSLFRKGRVIYDRMVGTEGEITALDVRVKTLQKVLCIANQVKEKTRNRKKGVDIPLETISRVETSLYKAGRLRSGEKRLEQCLSTLKQVTKDRETLKKETEALEKEEIRIRPPICPLCKGKVKK